MPRDYTTIQSAKISSRFVSHCELVELDCGGGTVLRWNTSAYTLEVLGQTWLGQGAALSISYPREDLTLAANPLVLYLAGNNAAVTSLALSRPLANAPLRVYHAIFDDLYAVLQPLLLDFSGRVSHVDLNNLADD